MRFVENKLMKKMKIIAILIFLWLGSSISFSQTTQEFTERFSTNERIYGYVEVITKTASYGFASLQVQQKRIVVQGINVLGDENYSGNDLAEFGISFPFECSNCYCYTNGDVIIRQVGYENYSPTIQGYPSASFSSAGSIHKLDYTSHTANFSQEIKNKHNEYRSKNSYSDWERFGRVWSINISGVAGGDLGRVTDAVINAQQTKENSKVDIPEITISTSKSEIEQTEKEKTSSTVEDQKVSQGEESTSDAYSVQRELDGYTDKEVSTAIRNGNYTKAAEIMKKNPHMYTPDQVQHVYTTNAVQSTAELIDLLFFSEPDWEGIARSKELYNEAEVEREKELKKTVVSKKINNAKITKKRSFYGVQDQEGNWLIPPKYFSIKLIEETDTEVKYEVVAKSLNTSYRTLKK